jgi:hypothetical protein
MAGSGACCAALVRSQREFDRAGAGRSSTRGKRRKVPYVPMGRGPRGTASLVVRLPAQRFREIESHRVIACQRVRDGVGGRKSLTCET